MTEVRIIKLGPDAFTDITFEYPPEISAAEALTNNAISTIPEIREPYLLLVGWAQAESIWTVGPEALSENFLRAGWDLAMNTTAAVFRGFSLFKTAKACWDKIGEDLQAEQKRLVQQVCPVDVISRQIDEAHKNSYRLKAEIERLENCFSEVQLLLMHRVFFGFSEYYGLSVGRRSPLQPLCDVDVSKSQAVPLHPPKVLH